MLTLRHMDPDVTTASSDLEGEWQALCDRLQRHGYSSLSEDERVWLNLRWLIDAVENGGLLSYFYNSGADTLEDCREALHRLNAHRILDCVARVTHLFGMHVPRTVEDRNRIIDAWPDTGPHDALLSEVDRDLMPLVHALDSQLEAFVSTRFRPPRS